MIAEPRLLGEQRRGPDLRDVDHLTDLQPAKDDVEIGAVSVDGPSAIVCFADLAEPPEKEKQIAATHSTALEMGLRSVGLTKQGRQPGARSSAA